MSQTQPIQVLFLCTHNAARSIMAQALLNHLSRLNGDRFKGYSAGNNPRPDKQAHPLALQILKNSGISTEGLHSKSWDEYAKADAPKMDLIITVCDTLAGETCPVWPGHPATAHWGYADPSIVEGTDLQKLEAFRQTLHAIGRRLELLVNLPEKNLQSLALQESVRSIV